MKDKISLCAGYAASTFSRLAATFLLAGFMAVASVTFAYIAASTAVSSFWAQHVKKNWVEQLFAPQVTREPIKN